MSFRFVPKSVPLNDLERRDGHSQMVAANGCLPVRPFTLVIRVQTVQHLEMLFAPYDRAICFLSMDARFLCGS